MKPPAGVSDALPETCRLIVTRTNEPGVASAAQAIGSGQNQVSECEASAREEPRSLATATPAAPVARFIRASENSTASSEVIEPREKTRESRITDDALSELDGLAAVGKPFFLSVSLPVPHAPWEVGEPYYSLHPRSQIKLPANHHSIEPADRSTAAFRFGQLLGEDGMREYLGVYYGLVSMMDWNVGRILDALHRRGMDSNTLVIFTADHGDMQGGHGCYDRSTFSMYEETTRVPLLIRWPGHAPADKVIRTQAASCDISPTILDYLGATAAACDPWREPAALHRGPRGPQTGDVLRAGARSGAFSTIGPQLRVEIFLRFERRFPALQPGKGSGRNGKSD